MWLRTTSTWSARVIGPSWASSAGPQTTRPRGQLGEELVVDPLMDVDPLHADAGLTGVGERSPRSRVGRVVDVGVLVDEQGVLAAALDDDRGEVLGTGGHHQLAGAWSSR